MSVGSDKCFQLYGCYPNQHKIWLSPQKLPLFSILHHYCPPNSSLENYCSIHYTHRFFFSGCSINAVMPYASSVFQLLSITILCLRLTYPVACIWSLGFSCGSDDKKSACKAGHLGLIPGLGRSPGEGNGYPF